MAEPTTPPEPRSRRTGSDPARAADRPAPGTLASDGPEIDATADTRGGAGPGGLDSVVLLLLGLMWFGATLWSAYRTIAGHTGDAADEAGVAAITLPSVVSAGIVAGMAAGLAASGLRLATGALRRAIAGAVAGGLCGLAGAALVITGYGAATSIVVLATTVGAAVLLGGVAAALPRSLLAAGVTGALGVFLTGVVFNLGQRPLMSVFGAGDTVASVAGAAGWLSFFTAMVKGVVAALIGYFYLRRLETGRRWTAFTLAGALPGLSLLAAAGITMIGGARLFAAVGQFSAEDRAALAYLSGVRLNEALTVAFVGAILATIAVGRTMKRPEEDDEDDGDNG